MKKRPITLFLVACCITFSCHEPTPTEPAIAIDEDGITAFIKFIDYSVREVQRMSSPDPSAATEAIVMAIPEFEKKYGVDLGYQSRGNTNGRARVASGPERDLAEKLIYYNSVSVSEDDYLRKLKMLKGEVMASGLSPATKSTLLTRIALNEELVKYLDKADQAAHSSEDEDDDEDDECSGWWQCWGKCVTGILGGAATGALTFGFAGAAVGTITLPVLGTVSAGTVGAIAGGVAGGLTGAASSCD